VTSPDLNDSDVRALLDRNHTPEEITVRRVDDTVATVIIACEKCGEPYPCPTRLALREEKDKRLRAHWVKYPRRPCSRVQPHREHSYTGFAAPYYCPGVEVPEPLETESCGGQPPHGGHLWRMGDLQLWCPGE
jgi:hypothetical protein